MTVRELIRKALLLIGAIAHGENISAEEAADAFATLNQMISSWSNEGLLVFANTIESFTLTAGDGQYSIGSSGDFNTTRPQFIDAATLVLAGSSPEQETPLDIFNIQEYSERTAKSQTSTIPWALFVNDTYPLAGLTLYPVPSAAHQLKLYTKKPLTAFTGLSQTISLPPGYEEAIKYNLALKLCPEYGRQADQLVVKDAIETKAQLKRKNTKPVYLKSDAEFLSQPAKFNIYTGGYQ